MSKGNLYQMEQVYNRFKSGEPLTPFSLQYEAERAILQVTGHNPIHNGILISKAVTLLQSYGYSIETSCLIVTQWLKLLNPDANFDRIIKDVRGTK